MQSDIKHTWFFDQSREEVWQYLTDAALIAKWLMPNDFQPVLGHRFRFRTNPIPSLNLNGIFHCEVLEIDPPKKLRYSWKGGPDNELATLDTMVLWTLDSKDNGTELQLVHSGFKEENAAVFAGMFNGWLQNIQKVVTLINANDHADTNS